MAGRSVALRFEEAALRRLLDACNPSGDSVAAGGKQLGPFLEWRSGMGIFVRALDPSEARMSGLSDDLAMLQTRHPLGNLDLPALPFPCTVDEFSAFASLPSVRMTDAVEYWLHAEEADVQAFARIDPHAAVLVVALRGPKGRGTAGNQQTKAQRRAAFLQAWARVGDGPGSTKELAGMFSVSERAIRLWKEEARAHDLGGDAAAVPKARSKGSPSALQRHWRPASKAR